MLHGGKDGDVGIAFAVLALGLVLEGASLIRATRQTGTEARRRSRSFAHHLRVTRDPTTKTVVFEDTAAVIGLLLAAAGLGLTQITGSGVWDGAASVAIGVLLAVVAFFLGRDSKQLLIGEGAQPEERETIARVFDDHPKVLSVEELLTMALGPASLLVAARLDFIPEPDSDAVEAIADELEQQLRDAVPEITEVFLDPTRRRVGR